MRLPFRHNSNKFFYFVYIFDQANGRGSMRACPIVRSSERPGLWPAEPSNCSRFIKNRARMQGAFDDDQCPSSFRGLECAIMKNARLHKEAELDFGFWGGTMHSDFTVFREHLAEACRDRKKSPDPL